MGDSSDLIAVEWAGHHEVLVSGLWRFFQLNHVVDFEISWGGRSIRAHQLILDVFLAPEKMAPTGAAKKFLSHVNRQRRDDCMDHLMEFLYTGKIEIKRDHLDRLREVAKQLDFQMLENAIELAVLNDKAQRGLSRVWMYSSNNLGSVPVGEIPELTLEMQTETQDVRTNDTESGPVAAESLSILPEDSDDDRMQSEMPIHEDDDDETMSRTNLDVSNSVLAVSPSAPPEPDIQASIWTPADSADQSHREGVCAATLETKPATEQCDLEALTPTEPIVKARSYRSMNLRTRKAVTPPVVEHCDTDEEPFEPNEPPPRPARRRAPFICDVCGKVFKRSLTLDEHSRIHTGAKPYKCQECGKSYAQCGSLIVHMRVHTGVKPFRCDQCGKTFTQSCNLNKHQLTHTKDKPHRCDICGLCFRERLRMNIHRFTHTDQMKYKCQFCEERFKDRRERSLHTLTHTGKTARVCQYCGMQFSNRHNFNAHVKKHRNVERPVFQCDVCGIALNTRFKLKLHSRIHTGERPHKCQICGKCFRRDVDLNLHSVSHRIRAARLDGESVTSQLSSDPPFPRPLD